MKINEVVPKTGISDILQRYSSDVGSFYVQQTPTSPTAKQSDVLSTDVTTGDNREVNPALSEPSVTTPLHPDVKVISSYPLRLKYKNGDYVLDPRTDQWLTVTGKRLAPTLAAFLQSQADKL